MSASMQVLMEARKLGAYGTGVMDACEQPDGSAGK